MNIISIVDLEKILPLNLTRPFHAMQLVRLLPYGGLVEHAPINKSFHA
jgi:hypothetical protein